MQLKKIHLSCPAPASGVDGTPAFLLRSMRGAGSFGASCLRALWTDRQRYQCAELRRVLAYAAPGAGVLVGPDSHFKEPARHCERSEAIHSYFLCGAMDCFASLAMTADTVSRSRGALRPSFAGNFPPSPKQRAQGMPGARCTRGLVCDGVEDGAHEHTGQRRASDIPCAMALRLITRSPR